MSDEKKKKKTLLDNGRYDAKVKAWGCKTNPNGKPFCWVMFDLGVFWQGYFVEGALPHTAKALAIMGFRGSTPMDLQNDNALDKEKTLSIVVENEDYNGERISKVAWVNEPYKPKEVSAEDAQILSGIDLRGYLKEHIQDAPQTQSQSDEQEEDPASSNFTADDIPF